ncbi:MAG TPA: cell division topological specificity factor MinE [Firmicutes bacterium]|mgnify:FL=1|nr:cell division topological specificity factor MinE [Bacillota bacterium]
MSFIKKLFSRKNKSGSVAKERLKNVLMADRAEIAGGVLESIKLEVLKILRNFKELDASNAAFDVQRYDKQGSGIFSIMVPLNANCEEAAV